MNKERKNQANLIAKECIVSALLQLIKEKPLSAITISELTSRGRCIQNVFLSEL